LDKSAENPIRKISKAILTIEIFLYESFFVLKKNHNVKFRDMKGIRRRIKRYIWGGSFENQMAETVCQK